MGNCQAIDSASLIIQHPNGKVDSFYSPIAASQIMHMNPGHYVALLLTTTLYSSKIENNVNPLRVTRIKLLRPNDTLRLGHVYRLVTTQEVMKGLWAKKQAKKCGNKLTEIKQSSDIEVKKTKQVKQERHSNKAVNSGASKSRQWQPSLNSISEAAS